MDGYIEVPEGSWSSINKVQYNAPVLIEESREFLERSDYAMQVIAKSHNLTQEYEAQFLAAAIAYCKHLSFAHHLVSRIKTD